MACSVICTSYRLSWERNSAPRVTHMRRIVNRRAAIIPFDMATILGYELVLLPILQALARKQIMNKMTLDFVNELYNLSFGSSDCRVGCDQGGWLAIFLRKSDGCLDQKYLEGVSTRKRGGRLIHATDDEDEVTRTWQAQQALFLASASIASPANFVRVARPDKAPARRATRCPWVIKHSFSTNTIIPRTLSTLARSWTIRKMVEETCVKLIDFHCCI